MLQVYVVSFILTLFITTYGVGFLFNSHSNLRKIKPNHFVPVYMWDIYNSGINSSEIDVIRGVHPTFTGFSFNFRNHRGRLLEFDISKSNEILIKAEVRITSGKYSKTYFQIYLKREKWIFLDEKKVSNVEMTWVSLQVTPRNEILKPGKVVFLILTIFNDLRGNRTDFQQPVLLLSYNSKTQPGALVRRKRNLDDYEEKTNRIWKDEAFTVGMRGRNFCRRKSLYVKFSEINYDSWIVAPSGYEAFQCIGKCTFPVGEHLSPTKHAILQTLLHNISPWKTGRACCVPTKLDPISILYIDENGVLTYRFKYRDMVVAECGCR